MCKKIIAVTGPSCAGKTTITQKIFKEYGFVIPRHTTTRAPRCDDTVGFYRHITFEEFNVYLREDKFLIASSDGVRGYGILKSDCEDAWCFSDTIILNVSYKDIQQLNLLPYKVQVVVLTFKDIVDGIKARMTKLSDRLHSPEDVDYRIESAQKDCEQYFSALKKYATVIAYTDTMSESETYSFVTKALKLEHDFSETIDESAQMNETNFSLHKPTMEAELDLE